MPVNAQTAQVDDLTLIALPTAVNCADLFVRFTLGEWRLRNMIGECSAVACALVEAAVESADPKTSRLITLRLRLSGDYLVIEVGHRNHGTSTANVRIAAGEPSATTDLPENETQTVNASGGSTYRGWIEFSATLVPYKAASAGNSAGTGAANQPKPTVKPTAGNAAGTGAAYDATVSYEPPPRSITIAGSDWTEYIMESDFALTECANRGEVGTGGVAEGAPLALERGLVGPGVPGVPDEDAAQRVGLGLGAGQDGPIAHGSSTYDVAPAVATRSRAACIAPGRLLMIPHTPRRHNATARAGSSTVQTWTGRPRRRAVATTRRVGSGIPR